MHQLKTIRLSPRSPVFRALPLLLAGIMACKTEPDKSPQVAPTIAITPVQIPVPRDKCADFSRGYIQGCKDCMVRVDDYCIDRFEDSVIPIVQRNGILVPETSPHPYGVATGSDPTLILKASVAPNSFPQSGISQIQADMACKNAGKRLCTLREWVKACVGPDNLTYPYGDSEQSGSLDTKDNKTWIDGACNTRRLYLLDRISGDDPSKWTMEDMTNPILTMVGTLAKSPSSSLSGAYLSCTNQFGAYNMVGNLHEWVSGLLEKGNAPLAGGFFGSGNQNGQGCYYLTKAHPPAHYDYSTGFRCCMDAGDGESK